MLPLPCLHCVLLGKRQQPRSCFGGNAAVAFLSSFPRIHSIIVKPPGDDRWDRWRISDCFPSIKTATSPYQYKLMKAFQTNHCSGQRKRSNSKFAVPQPKEGLFPICYTGVYAPEFMCWRPTLHRCECCELGTSGSHSGRALMSR